MIRINMHLEIATAKPASTKFTYPSHFQNHTPKGKERLYIAPQIWEREVVYVFQEYISIPIALPELRTLF